MFFSTFFRFFSEFFRNLSEPCKSLRGVTLSLRQLEHYNILSISVSSVFHNFFRIFWNFFRSFRIPAFPRRCYPLAQTARLFYHTSMGMSTVFRNFFVFFWDFFDVFLRLQPLVVCFLFRHNRCPFFPVSFLPPPIFFPFFGRAGLPFGSVFPLCVFSSAFVPLLSPCSFCLPLSPRGFGLPRTLAHVVGPFCPRPLPRHGLCIYIIYIVIGASSAAPAGKPCKGERRGGRPSQRRCDDARRKMRGTARDAARRERPFPLFAILFPLRMIALFLLLCYNGKK